MSQAVAIVGVDPGLGGALAVAYQGRVDTFDMPTLDIKGKRRIDMHALWTIVRDIRNVYAPALAVVEDVHAMPKQGVTSSFTFGRVAAAVEMALVAAGIPMHLVAPGAWKRLMGLSADKDASRLLASRLYPASASQWSRKKDDGRAEAAVLAHYGSKIL